LLNYELKFAFIICTFHNMFLAVTFPSIQLGDSQDHIYLVTNSFFNDFAFIVLCSLNIYSTLLALFDMLLVHD